MSLFLPAHPGAGVCYSNISPCGAGFTEGVFSEVGGDNSPMWCHVIWGEARELLGLFLLLPAALGPPFSSAPSKSHPSSTAPRSPLSHTGHPPLSSPSRFLGTGREHRDTPITPPQHRPSPAPTRGAVPRAEPSRAELSRTESGCAELRWTEPSRAGLSRTGLNRAGLG